MTYLQQLMFLCPLIFVAGFIDSVAGGGGLISLPAFMMTGLPMHNCLATNKLSNSFGSATAALRYAKSGKINWPSALTSAVFSFMGSWLGSIIVLNMDAVLLKKGFTFMMPLIALFVLGGKKASEAQQKYFGAKMLIMSGVVGFGIGIYSGVIGPGDGTFLILAYTMIIGFDHITSSANAKIVTFASMTAAVINFLLARKVVWALAIPVTIVNIAGSYIGAAFAIKHGNNLIKKMQVIVLIGVFLKLIIDVF